MVLKFAKKFLRIRKDQPLSLLVKEPSQAFLEEDFSRQDLDHRVPPEVLYMLKGVRVFGFFDKPLFLEMCKKLEFIQVPKGELLFSLGDPDDSIYIVQTGRMQVFITEPDGSELTLKEACPGDTIVSLLSVLDVLSAHLSPFKTVSAKSLEDSTVIRLQVYVFRDLLEKYPDSLVRVVQVIMARLQRVMFTALHDYLGLSSQLVIPGPINGCESSINNYKGVITCNPESSPSRPARPTRVSVIHVLEKQRSMNEIDTKEMKNIIQPCTQSTCSEVNSTADSPDVLSTLPASSHTLDNNSDDTLSDLPVNQVSPKLKLVNPHFEKIMRKRSIFGNDDRLHAMNEDELQQLAIEGFTQQLGLEDGPEILSNKVKVKEFINGTLLTHEETRDGASLFYVLSGCLVVSQKNFGKESEEVTLYQAFPGELVGALAVITSEVSAFTTRTKGSSKIGIISGEDTYEILTKYPQSVLHLAHTVIRRLSPFVRQIDFALDWINYESGRAIYRQGDTSDSTYIVLSGRLRSVISRENGKKELIGEYGRSDLIGIVELLTLSKRSTTVMAVRDSELAKLPAGLLDVIKIKFPVVVSRLIHLLGHRILGSIQEPGASLTPADIGSRPSGSNFDTVALVAISDDVPLMAFSLELNHAISSIGPSLLLNSDSIRGALGPNVLDSPASEYILNSWLAQQEDRHRIVLYQCDKSMSNWTQRCIRQADCILFIGLADQEPSVGRLEKDLEHLTIRTQKELVLLHREDAERPHDTVKWLNMRSWCSSHHHIRCPKRVFMKTRSPGILREYAEALSCEPDIHSDVSRLGRFLTGTSIGLVLGGGGARGAAHIGMIKAIQEAGIPIDMVGGVSIGAFMGALWCQELNLDTMRSRARSWSLLMTSRWRQVLDLTYPITAMFTGSAFNKTIFDTFGDMQIEDLWLPYFTVTTDITSSRPRIHRFGSLWRYVRSSMSLSGYLPPLCDPIDGHLLLDGGYVNNLPGDVMREVMGAETILAVDVGSQDDSDMTNYGDELSGWWLLWNKWNPFGKKIRVPNLPEIQSRLAYVSCVRQLEQVKRSDYCTYIRPPIDKYKTLQFASFDEIFEVGYIHGKNFLENSTNDSSNAVIDKEKKLLIN